MIPLLPTQTGSQQAAPAVARPATYLANPGVSCRESQPAGVASLFNPDTNAALGVNATGQLLWQALARPHTRDQLVAHLLASYPGTAADQVAADIDAFLRRLQPMGFVGLVLDATEPGPGDLEAEAGGTQAEPEGAGDDEGVEVAVEECERYYRGRSMRGTFRHGDRLVVEPVAPEDVRLGDVVLFRQAGPDGEQQEVVHRVVARAPGGLVTRGDRNRRADQEPVTQENLVGRVTSVDRAGHERAIPGGRGGLVRLRVRRRLLRARQAGWRLVWPAARQVYRWVRDSGLAQKVWRPEITRVAITAGQRPMVKYVVGGRTVAKWWPASGRFWCRRPYQLLIRPPGEERGDRT